MIALLSGLLACVQGPGGYTSPVASDPERFAAEVQPVLEARCANATCHGDSGRPLEIYAVHRHRLDPEDVYLDAGLSGAEMELNFLRASAFIEELSWLSSPDDCALLHKPLDPEAGGSEHRGGVQFFDVEEREYQAIRGWIAQSLGAE